MSVDRRWVPAALLVAAGAIVVAVGAQDEQPVLSRAVPPESVAVPPGPTPGPRVGPVPREVVAPPAWIAIPSIDVRSDLLGLGLNSDRTLEVPSSADADRAGWYRYSSRPGAPGPAVVVGHLDSQDGPAVFHRLAELDEDDEIRIGRTDGTTVRFRVIHVGQYAKTDFPTDAVYSETSGAELRLITCGGSYRPDGGGYQDNVIVFAVAMT